MNVTKSKDFLFFWGHTNKTGVINKTCLSQRWPCRFSVDDVTYSSTEQYLMAGKARLFKDTEMLEKILETDDPSVCKALGLAVKTFNQAVWEANRWDIAYKGNLAKFLQNEQLREFLMSTGSSQIVEASPYDRVWGIGMLESDPRATSPSQWLGDNLLGEVLTSVRGTIYKWS